MGQGRRQFTDEFKQEAVALLVSSGRPLIQIASELGISPSMLRNWHNGGGGRDAGSALRPIPASARYAGGTPADAQNIQETGLRTEVVGHRQAGLVRLGFPATAPHLLS
jgi:transposase